MERKVAQTELDPAEYSTLASTARKKGLTIKEALREAALRWTQEESGINPNDPIFHFKARDWGKGTENASREVDENTFLEAWELYKSRREIPLSLTDCTSAILARKQGVTDMYSYDSDFEALGFRVLGQL